MDGQDAFREYCRCGSERAFREIVEQHTRLVYSVCLHILGDSHLAEDAVQAVFLVLAKKARSIRSGKPLTGWLYQTSIFVARQ